MVGLKLVVRLDQFDPALALPKSLWSRWNKLFQNSGKAIDANQQAGYYGRVETPACQFDKLDKLLSAAYYGRVKTKLFHNC